MAEAGIVCVFAKPPVAGEVKTRLAAKLGAPRAAALARAFFDDTWARLSAVPSVRVVLASTRDDSAAFGLEGLELWLQGEGDLGARLERVMQRALKIAPWVIAVGADSPAMPRTTLANAIACLATHDAVLGPVADGGYCLIGLRSLHPGLLSGLPWSTPQTSSATLERLTSRGLKVALLPLGFDVDEVEDLSRLRDVLAMDPTLAPRTAALLRSFERGGQ